MVGEQLYTIYSKLEEIAEKEFGDIIKSTDFIGGKASAPNKLRIFFIDNSFLDVRRMVTIHIIGNTGHKEA